jgi:hypothetical protein
MQNSAKQFIGTLANVNVGDGNKSGSMFSAFRNRRKM